MNKTIHFPEGLCILEEEFFIQQKKKKSARAGQSQ
jgi:hypothetical protein